MRALYSAAGKLQRAPIASFVRLARHRGRRIAWEAQSRWLADVVQRDEAKDAKSLALSSSSRYNEVGVQQLSDHIFPQIFPGGSKPPPEELVRLSRDHLKRHDLYGKNTDTSEPVAFDLPELKGNTLDEHFHKLGIDCAEPYLRLAKEFACANVPLKPKQWVHQSGWTKYHSDGTPPESVESPDEEMLCFDTEVMYKNHHFAVMACAVSPTAWYSWLSPWLLGETDNERQLIPIGDPTKDRIIVGHNVGYDRARILEEYNLKQTRTGFLDTMSLHVAVNGMCSRQRPAWQRSKKNREMRERIASQDPDHGMVELLSNPSIHEEEELWVERSSVNSLRDVAKFHLNVTIDKSKRDDFAETDREVILKQLDQLLEYCAADVSTTHRVYQIVLPSFLNVCPHPVSFAALRHLSSVILPVNETWEQYIANADALYNNLLESVQKRLEDLAEKAKELKNSPEIWGKDPWMMQLDWTKSEKRLVKSKDNPGKKVPDKRQKKAGEPKWYRDLFANKDAPINLTVRSRIAPLLLKLAWDGHPLFWSNKYGWVFRVNPTDVSGYIAKKMPECVFDDSDPALRADWGHSYFKLPHKDGPTARCSNPMAKGYLNYFENGTLSSEYEYAKEALEMNASCSYWISARDRIRSQMVVYENDILATGEGKAMEAGEKRQGFILPQVIPMGTITRRAVEKTWLTASNAKKNRVGSELKSMVKAPDGYCFVGADVDSEELWIASLVGDATFKIHGGNAIGFMTLEGTKAAGTDLHSRTAAILGITRNDAKVFNYGRIYGAGLNFAATLLRQFNPALSERETMMIAQRLYTNTKGTKTTRRAINPRKFWRGGTESFVFNKLEEFAEQDWARTPVLGAGITQALMSRFVSKGGYLPSRINWAIQSSGVDYLHLLIVSMDYLIRRFNLDARLAITVHDEIRYLVKNEDKYRAALALQVANIWTRAMFAQQVGINDLPQSCAFFSAVDIDHVLRKEVNMDCVTPSHKTPIPHGESLDIQTLLDKGAEAMLDPSIVPDPKFAPKLDGIAYTPRTPIMQTLQESGQNNISFIKAQIANDDQELQDIVNNLRKATTPNSTIPKSTTRKPRAVSLKGVIPYQSKDHPKVHPKVHSKDRSKPWLTPLGEPISDPNWTNYKYQDESQSGMAWSKNSKVTNQKPNISPGSF
ncbi:DNA polymerase gamma, the mitochondrial replicativeDNA polymerase [Trichoderma guizhouense]|uniref:DNA-directed DNA polymerase n=1 Tax=Trichoderma guizhouense TaxID=1491466 RepID=A0A1T3CVQ7_9HYPO|nr:DNA polymerase gamma, the mitochondrial replicativeDNA polymerase [Trichoderma guizhouense]